MKQGEREGKITNSVISRVMMYKFQGLSENCSNFYTQVSTTNSVLFHGSPKNELTGAGFFLHICECYYINYRLIKSPAWFLASFAQNATMPGTPKNTWQVARLDKKKWTK
jgi:hypothetical protein